MMRQYYITLFASALLSLVSCKEDTTGFAESEGSLKLSVGMSDKVEVEKFGE